MYGPATLTLEPGVAGRPPALGPALGPVVASARDLDRRSTLPARGRSPRRRARGSRAARKLGGAAGSDARDLPSKCALKSSEAPSGFVGKLPQYSQCSAPPQQVQEGYHGASPPREPLMGVPGSGTWRRLSALLRGAPRRCAPGKERQGASAVERRSTTDRRGCCRAGHRRRRGRAEIDPRDGDVRPGDDATRGGHRAAAPAPDAMLHAGPPREWRRSGPGPRRGGEVLLRLREAMIDLTRAPTGAEYEAGRRPCGNLRRRRRTHRGASALDHDRVAGRPLAGSRRSRLRRDWPMSPPTKTPSRRLRRRSAEIRPRNISSS